MLAILVFGMNFNYLEGESKCDELGMLFSHAFPAGVGSDVENQKKKKAKYLVGTSEGEQS